MVGAIVRPGLATITVHNLVKQFGNVVAVGGVDFSVPHGAFLTLLGPSGCGKTTILRMLAGLESPSSGRILFDDKLVADGQKQRMEPSERQVGLVFQSYALWPHMCVRENIAWPLKVKRWGAIEREKRVHEVMDLLEIGVLADRYPHQISGGQQQRAAIARTLAPKPDVLLFDEPLSNLDAKLRAEMRGELLRVHRTSGATCIYVTHDQAEAIAMATHIAVMRDGLIEQFGTPSELLNEPVSPFVASFVGTPPANLIEGELCEGHIYYAGIDLGLADRPLNRPLVMYRAESLKLDRIPGNLVLPVEFIEAIPMAGRAVATVWDGRYRLSIILEGLPMYHFGDRLFLRFPEQPDAVFANNHVRDAR